MGIIQLSFFDSKVCSRCGEGKPLGEFSHSLKSKDGYNGWCRVCFIQYKREYYVKNAEKMRSHSRNWSHQHRDVCRSNLREWRQKNPAKHCTTEHQRRARIHGGGGSYTTQEWDDLCAQYDYRCVRCRQQKPLTADHIVPVSKGGSSDIANIQPLCASCNSSKRDKTVDYRS